MTVRPPTLGPVGSAYVLVVTALATVGAVTDSTAAILLAGVLTLPTSIPAVVGYYVVYGLLAQVPGASPDSSSGSMSCTSTGECTGSGTGDPASWFVVVTSLVGILALVACALVNAVVVRDLVRGRPGASARTRTGA